MTTRQCSTSALLQRYCSDTTAQDKLYLFQRQEWPDLLCSGGAGHGSQAPDIVRLHQAEFLCQGVLILFCGKAVTWDRPKKVAFTSQLAWGRKCNSNVTLFSCLYWFHVWTNEELGHYDTSLFFKLPNPPPLFFKQHLEGAKWNWYTKVTHRSQALFSSNIGLHFCNLRWFCHQSRICFKKWRKLLSLLPQ